MKHIKSYKIFESDTTIDSKLIDCLVELFDYGFEPDDELDITKELLSDWLNDNNDLIKTVKLFKEFKGLKFSNYLEGDFDKDSFGPGDKNPRTREYTIKTKHIEDEILELVDDASHKIINTYIPEASRGEYMINEYSIESGTCVTIILKFFK
jgi:hypothetical protein